MKRRTILYVPVLGALALTIAAVALADAPTDVWTEGAPAETDDDTFEWAEGLPYIIYEEATAPTPTPTPTPTPYAEPPTSLTVTPHGWDDDCDFWSGTALLEWTPGLNANGTIIRLNYCDCPGTLEEGQLVYDGNGTSMTFDLVISSLGKACFSAWGYNNLGNSTAYTCTCVGGESLNTIAAVLEDLATILPLLGFPVLLILAYYWKRTLVLGLPGALAAGAAVFILEADYGWHWAGPMLFLAIALFLQMARDVIRRQIRW